MEYTVRQLPSGFWAIFAGDEWIDAAQPTQEAALAFAGRLKGGGDPRMIILFIILLPFMVIWETAKKS